ncbi:hypothetical protein ACEQPO_26635 [Bacillus sp. SL00103]
MVLIQYLFGIRSMRRSLKKLKPTWLIVGLLDMGFLEKIQKFFTFGKLRETLLHDTDLFEQIFYRILREAMKKGSLTRLLPLLIPPCQRNANKKN